MISGSLYPCANSCPWNQTGPVAFFSKNLKIPLCHYLKYRFSFEQFSEVAKLISLSQICNPTGLLHSLHWLSLHYREHIPLKLKTGYTYEMGVHIENFKRMKTAYVTFRMGDIVLRISYGCTTVANKLTLLSVYSLHVRFHRAYLFVYFQCYFFM